MIKNITASSKYILVSGGAGSTYIPNNSGAQGVGNMRYNTINQNMEVYDGMTWMTLNTGITSIALTAEAEVLLDWAKQKRNEELERERLAQSNPTIKDLVNQIKEKEEQVKVVMTLLKSAGDEGTKVPAQ